MTRPSVCAFISLGKGFATRAVNTREQRIARNEALLREVNERIRGVGERFQVLPDNGELDFRCECGRRGCDTFVHMQASD